MATADESLGAEVSSRGTSARFDVCRLASAPSRARLDSMSATRGEQSVFLVRRVARGFFRTRSPDAAAGLTCYALLALMPALMPALIAAFRSSD